ncbi:MAG: helix-turn-helix transcriptional regulator [Oscillospiraceae bacterium]|nr:helix-turn-helix transcriptional regulator [Oscillospiraceae bacterium]
MRSTLFDYEWQFLIQMTTRINYCETYPEICNTFLQQIRTLIPYGRGVVFQAGRASGRVLLTSPISTEYADDRSSHNFFIEGKYPHWDEFVMLPYSSVFRQSDIIQPGKWEKTRVYRDVWQPKGMFWGLFTALVHKDVPLVVLGIQREKSLNDFSDRDIYIMNTLKDPLERKFFSLFEDRRISSGDGGDRIFKTSAGFGLTKRETEIVSLICAGKGSDEMCQSLFITHATLSKHLSNIYSKTNVKNRTQLFALFL